MTTTIMQMSKLGVKIDSLFEIDVIMYIKGDYVIL
jgi:hypothetical protein